MQVTQEEIVSVLTQLPESPEWSHELSLVDLLTTAKDVQVYLDYKDRGSDDCYDGASLLALVSENETGKVWAEVAVSDSGWMYVDDLRTLDETQVMVFDIEEPSILDKVNHVFANAATQYLQKRIAEETEFFFTDAPEELASATAGKNLNGREIVASETPISVNLLRLNSPAANGYVLTYNANREFIDGLVSSQDTYSVCGVPNDPTVNIMDDGVLETVTLGTVSNFSYDRISGILSGEVVFTDKDFKAKYLKQTEAQPDATVTLVTIANYKPTDIKAMVSQNSQANELQMDDIYTFQVLTRGHVFDSAKEEIPFAPTLG
jgi:hypothetical protein